MNIRCNHDVDYDLQGVVQASMIPSPKIPDVVRRFIAATMLVRYLPSLLISVQLLIGTSGYAQTQTVQLPADSLEHLWYNKYKYHRFGRSLQNALSFDGNIRSQYFYVHNEDWGDKIPEDDGYILARFLARADLRLGKMFRSVIHLQSSLAPGREGAGPVDVNPLEIHEWYVEAGRTKARSFKLKFGRQELSYGSQRLVALRDGPNNRQSFDGIKICVSIPGYDMQTFYSRPVVATMGSFNDKNNKGSQFWGLYNVFNDVPLLSNVDLYYLGIARKHSVFNDGAGREERHTAGTRFWKKSDGWNYDIEVAFQLGRFAQKKIRAYTASINVSYVFNAVYMRPELGLKTELISGDLAKNDTRLGTFNPMFPRGSYFGLAALIGPYNLVDVHPSVMLTLKKDLRFMVDWIAFKRYSRNDGMYASNGMMIYRDSETDVREIGYQLAAAFYFTTAKHLSLRAEFTWFDAGQFLKIAGTGKDIIFTGVTAELRW
ncbi:alginate export family protein [Flavitalea antarctica]